MILVTKSQVLNLVLASEILVFSKLKIFEDSAKNSESLNSMQYFLQGFMILKTITITIIRWEIIKLRSVLCIRKSSKNLWVY